jgi:thiosulfate dehydrogenase [quinone] large subunit
MVTDRKAAMSTSAISTPVAIDGLLSRVIVTIVRVATAMIWIQNVSWKIPPDFGRATNSGLYYWTRFAVDNPVFPPYAAFVRSVVLPNLTVFGWITVLIEAGLGAFLLIGLATRLWAVIGLAQTVAIMLSVLNAPHEWHWSYYLMLLAHLALFATAAGRSFGVDAVLRPRWRKNPTQLNRLLTGLS